MLYLVFLITAILHILVYTCICIYIQVHAHTHTLPTISLSRKLVLWKYQESKQTRKSVTVPLKTKYNLRKHYSKSSFKWHYSYIAGSGPENLQLTSALSQVSQTSHLCKQLSNPCIPSVCAVNFQQLFRPCSPTKLSRWLNIQGYLWDKV